MTEEKLILHHIGARSGSRSFPNNKKFESEMINVLYEADEDCIGQIKEVYKSSMSNFVIYPYCISDKSEEINFNISFDPNLSSLLTPSNSRYNFYYFNGIYDYSFNENSKIVKKVKVNTTTLDEIYLKNKDKFFLPDFISLDTQGSELKIINGSPICVTNTLAIVLEVGFIEFYNEQPCFDEIIRTMHDKGYEFIRFTNSIEQLPLKYPVGLRSRGRFTDGDALFIRPIHTLEKIGRNNITSYYKLAYIYMSFEMLELALECMEKIESKWGLLEKKKYYKLLNEVYSHSKKYKNYPKKFSDFFDKKVSLSRYNKISNESNIKSFIKSIKYLNKLLRIIIKFFGKLNRTIISILNFTKIICKLNKNKLEKLLEKNGFRSLSKTIYKNRIDFYKARSELNELKKNIRNLK